MKALLLIAVLLISASALTRATQKETHDLVDLDIYAVKSGISVTYSTFAFAFDHIENMLDSEYCWASRYLNQDQWIQVNSPVRKKWLGVVTQGRHNAAQWIKSYQVEYSDDGIYWDQADQGHNFPGNSDMNTQVKHWFDDPFWARSVRLRPKSWYGWISTRFDFIFYGQCLIIINHQYLNYAYLSL